MFDSHFEEYIIFPSGMTLQGPLMDLHFTEKSWVYPEDQEDN